MKSVIIGITTFLLCNSINAQILNSNYEINSFYLKTEKLKINDHLFTKSLIDYSFIGKDCKLEYPVMGVASSTPYFIAAFSGNNSSWDEGLKMSIKTRTFISAGLFIPTILTGYSMRSSNGKPNDGLLSVHKLTTVSNLVLLDATVLKKRKTTSLSLIETLVAITMNVSFAATITTGGLQSIGQPIPGWVNTSHKITPWITILSSGALLYLLNQ